MEKGKEEREVEGKEEKGKGRKGKGQPLSEIPRSVPVTCSKKLTDRWSS